MDGTLKNDRFLCALKRQPVDHTPIWIMRQAGRYLPEYRATRQKAGSFLTLCKTPELACEVTLQPLARFDLDAAILFSDILTIPDAMGLGLYFEEGEGPKFKKRIQTAGDIAALKLPDVKSDLGYVLAAVQEILKQLKGDLPLIGFSGSPWTLATYVVEGGASKDFRGIKSLLYQEPGALHGLLDILTAAVAEYLIAQIEAGVHAVQIFDTWGGILSSENYKAFSLNYMSRVIQQIRKVSDVPVIVFTKGGGYWLEAIAQSGATCVGLDWMIDIKEAMTRVKGQVTLQGNLDPSVLYGSEAIIEQEVKRILDAVGGRPGHVFNLGHGITPDIKPEKVKFLVDLVHQYSRQSNGRWSA